MVGDNRNVAKATGADGYLTWVFMSFQGGYQNKYMIDKDCVARTVDSVRVLPDSKIHGANMGPNWVLSAPDGPHVGPRNLVIRAVFAKARLIASLSPGWILPSSDYTFRRSNRHSVASWQWYAMRCRISLSTLLLSNFKRNLKLDI